MIRIGIKITLPEQTALAVMRALDSVIQIAPLLVALTIG